MLRHSLINQFFSDAKAEMMMRSFFMARLVRSFLQVAALAIALWTSPLYAQDQQQQDPRQADVRPVGDVDFTNFRNRTDFTLASPEMLPRQIAAQLRNCDYKSRHDEFPIRFIEPAPLQRFALVFCSGISGVSHRVFDISNSSWRQAPAVSFAVLAIDRGFTATMTPGFLEWDKDAGLFTTRMSSDLCPSPVIRHTYRLGRTSGGFLGSPFVLIKVEGTDGECLKRNGPFDSLWEAPQWPPSTVIR
jgi:hypothetical protein